MTMLEKVASALFLYVRNRAEKNGLLFFDTTRQQWSDLPDFARREYLDEARGAIEAMRLSVNDPLTHEFNRYADHDVWYWHNQMIDAALNEKA